MKIFSPQMLLLFSLVAFSCNQSKSVSSNSNSQPVFFVIGSGGGFTGMYTQFRISNSGLIEIYDFKNQNYKELKRVDPIEVRDFFDRIKTLDLANISFNKPGNLSEYIEVTAENKKLNRIVWAKGSADINPDIVSLFNDTKQFIASAGKN